MHSMNQKGFINIVLVILVVVLVSVAGYFTLVRKPQTKIVSNEFQEILNRYSACVNKNDIICQCEYLTTDHCESERNGRRQETIYAVNSKLLKGPAGLKGYGIVNLGTKEYNIPNRDPKIYTRLTNFFFLVKSGEYSGSCLSLTFIEESGKWKVFDVDGPTSMSYCKQ